MKLTLIRGLPGSGKSTYAKTHFSCLHLENDMFHINDGSYDWTPEGMKEAVKWCSETCRKALELGMDVVVSNTFTKRSHVEFYRKIAMETHAEFEVYRCTGDYGNVHEVPEATFESMKSGFEDYPGEFFV